MVKVNIPSIKLNNGQEIPALGYGTWLGVNDKIEFQIGDLPKMMEALSFAIDIGYRHIDTAHFYRIEPEVGQVINDKIKEGVVKRSDLFVTTKVWQHYHRAADVEVSLRASLKRLKLDYVDLVLMHWPMSISNWTKLKWDHTGSTSFQMKKESAKSIHPIESYKEEGVDEKIDYLETWRGFEAVLSKGLTKGIGVSNFNVEQMTRLLASCKIPPATNQVEINLTLGQPELVNLCQSQNIAIVAYSPFGSMVPSRTSPNSPEPTLNNPTLVAIAKKHGKTVSQIALRHLYQRGIISIPKTATKSRVIENASIFDFALDDTDVAAISAFDVGYRTVRPIFWQHYTNYPFDIVKEKMDKIPLAHRKWKNGANLDMD